MLPTKSTMVPVSTTGADSGACRPPARYSMTVPGWRRRFPGLTRHSQTRPRASTSSRRLSRSVSHTPPVPLLTHQASGHDAGLVGDEQVARLEVVEDVEEVAVLDGAVLAVQHEQAAGVAGLGRGLGDELVGQRVVKVFGAHVRGPSLMAPRGRAFFSPDSVARPPWTRRGLTCRPEFGRRGTSGSDRLRRTPLRVSLQAKVAQKWPSCEPVVRMATAGPATLCRRACSHLGFRAQNIHCIFEVSSNRGKQARTKVTFAQSPPVSSHKGHFCTWAAWRAACRSAAF